MSIANEKQRPPSVFPAHDPAGYEQLMGRWTRRLAPLLIEFGGLADGEHVLDVGCGTGSLSYALPESANVGTVTGIDQSEVYLDYARQRGTDPRFTFQHADARALPFGDATFDRAFSMLVLPFIPDAENAVAEMRRVVRPGGTVVAAVLDLYGGMPAFRLFYDTAAALDPTAGAPRALFYPMTAPDEMSEVWRRIGLTEVAQASLTIRIEFADFEDYWRPLEGRDGPFEALLASLSQPARATLREYVQRGFLCNRPDGLRSFAATALACRGIVPG